MRNKDSYYLALRRTQGTLDKEAPDWLPWLSFFLRSLKAQKDHLEAKMADNRGWESLPADSVKVLLRGISGAANPVRSRAHRKLCWLCHSG